MFKMLNENVTSSETKSPKRSNAKTQSKRMTTSSIHSWCCRDIYTETFDSRDGLSHISNVARRPSVPARQCSPPAFLRRHRET